MKSVVSAYTSQIAARVRVKFEPAFLSSTVDPTMRFAFPSVLFTHKSASTNDGRVESERGNFQLAVPLRRASEDDWHGPFVVGPFVFLLNALLAKPKKARNL